MNKKLFTKGAAAAFAMPALLLLLLFICKGYYPFGDRCFLTGDLYHQYLPFFEEFYRKIWAGEGLSFSFNVGIGSNFLALFVYYLASPFHLLGLLVPEDYLIEFISYLTVIKAGLCGFTAYHYLRRHFGREEFGMVLCGVFYAFSGFMAAYNYNIMWIDCVWLLPLIVLGLEYLVKEGKPALYCLTLGLSIYTNYYLSIMICIFLVMYFVALLVQRGGHKIRSVLYFGIFSLLAGGLAGVLLVPEVVAILQTDFGSAEFPKKIETYFSVLDMLARHCMCVSVERGLDHWPNIYCGTVVMMLIPMYLMNRKISVREKFAKLAVAGIFLLGFSVNVLNFIWHGFNYPDSLPARQSFIYCFLVLVMAYEAFLRVREAEAQQVVYGYLMGLGFVLFCQKFVTDDAFGTGDRLVTIVFLSIFGILLYLYRTRTSRLAITGVAVVAAVAVLAEAGINTYDTSLGSVSRSGYVKKEADYRELYEYTKTQEDSVYRVEKFSRRTKNDGTLTGYPTASVFSSTLNSQVMNLFDKLGMRHSKVYYGYDGATAFTQALLNVSYMFSETDDYECSQYTKVKETDQVYLYRCETTLPFGYVVPEDFEVPESDSLKGLKLQNRMVSDLGIEKQLFTQVDNCGTKDEVVYTVKADGIYYGVMNTSGVQKVKYTGATEEEFVFNDLKYGCVLYLGYLEKGQQITLTNNETKDDKKKISVILYRMDEEVLAQAVELLGKEHLTNVAWESDLIEGDITLGEGGRVILTVPYEDGWKITVNGEEFTGELFGGCLMALPLEAGSYHIKCEYTPAGSGAGWLLTGISLVVFAALMCLMKRSGKGKLPAEQEDADVPDTAETEAEDMEVLSIEEAEDAYEPLEEKEEDGDEV